MTQWVDYKELRGRLDFAAVLRHYGVELKVKGRQHQGFCPLPGHDGKRRSPSFSANLERGIWQCFGCGGKGNVIEFAALMEKLDPKDKDDFRRAALILQERFAGETPAAGDGKATSAKVKNKAAEKPEQPATAAAEETKRILVNAPLDFELKSLDPNHRFVSDRGITPETAVEFGLGYCNRGLMKGRIAIPLHDAGGRLIGYAGRLVDELSIDENNPKYLFPSRRERGGMVYEFKKSLFLYNGFRQCPPGPTIVVEGFASVWWLSQNDYCNTVALMGSSCSPEQADLLVKLANDFGQLPPDEVWVMPDGDDAGERMAMSVFAQIGTRAPMRWLKLPAGKQPTDCTADDLRRLIPPW